MSIGSPALNTLLVQRLDAVLGTTLAQNAQLINGARADAVAAPGSPAWVGQADPDQLRDPRQAAERVAGRQAQTSVQDTKLETALGLMRSRVVADQATASAPTSLGPAARTILALLARYPDTAPPVAGRAPLWQSAAPDPAASTAGSQPASAAAGAAPASGAAPGPLLPTPATQAAPGAGLQAPAAAALALALAQAVNDSGMFYESQLARASFGDRPLAPLAAQPQAQAGQALPAQPQPAPTLAAPAAAEKSVGAPGASERALQPGQASSTLAAAANPSTTAQAVDGAASGQAATAANNAPAAQAGAGGTHAALPGVHPDTALLVRQQLEVLANQVFAWRGEAWPGTPLDWEISRDGPATQDSQAASSWATRLTLTLPRLGTVQARLNLHAEQLVMHLAAPDSRDELHAHSQLLRDRYAAAGLSLSSLTVDTYDPAVPAAGPARPQPQDPQQDLLQGQPQD